MIHAVTMYFYLDSPSMRGFPHSSVSKESTCNAGDLGSIPELGRSPEEENGLQYSCLENPHGQRSPEASIHGVARVRDDLATKPPPAAGSPLSPDVHAASASFFPVRLS